MSYEPTNWVNGETPINAENLNKIEQKLVDLDKNGGGTGNVDLGSADISGIGDGTVTGAIREINGNLSRLMPVSLYSYTGHTAVKDTYVLTKTIKIPANSAFAITARPEYYNHKPTGIRICNAENSGSVISYQEHANTSTPDGISCSYSSYVTSEKTLYIYAKWAGSSVNNVEITGFYIPV